MPTTKAVPAMDSNVTVIFSPKKIKCCLESNVDYTTDK